MPGFFFCPPRFGLESHISPASIIPVAIIEQKSYNDLNRSKFAEEKKMPRVKLTITESKCRCGYFKKGQEFIVEDLCPPLCHELWNSIYPSVYALRNGASLDYGDGREKAFDAKCPDGGRVCIHGEVLD